LRSIACGSTGAGRYCTGVKFSGKGGCGESGGREVARTVDTTGPGVAAVRSCAARRMTSSIKLMRIDTSLHRSVEVQ
jgi:hypothetical protein